MEIHSLGLALRETERLLEQRLSGHHPVKDRGHS